MPYYHRKDDGKILWLKFPRFWEVKCSKCKKRWSLSALFGPFIPKDMVLVKKKNLAEAAQDFSKRRIWFRRFAIIFLIGFTFLIAYFIRGIS